MSTDTDIEGFVDALRRDGPSDRDAARMQARLAALGVVTGASIAKGAVASALPAGKVAAGVATRWASLSLLPKIGVVAAVSATALAGAVAVHQRDEAPLVARSTEHVAAAPRSAAPAVAAAAPATEPQVRDVAAAAQATEPQVRNLAAAAQATSGAARPPQLGAPPAKNAVAAAPRAAGEAAPFTPPSEAATASFDGVANAAPAPTSTLPEETALIDAAYSALRAGDTATASALVAEHARRFPNGHLSREREHARERLSKASAAVPLR